MRNPVDVLFLALFAPGGAPVGPATASLPEALRKAGHMISWNHEATGCHGSVRLVVFGRNCVCGQNSGVIERGKTVQEILSGYDSAGNSGRSLTH
ncbi:MAG: hypothetical protein ACWA5A_12720 [Marinibacterium sp.]